MKIVIIDDEKLTIDCLTEELESFNSVSVVGEFTNPMEALANIEQLNPDVVFLDVKINDTDGFKLAKQIKDILPHVYFVFVTAHSEYAARAFRLNAIDYIIKPIQKECLRETYHRLHDRIGETVNFTKNRPVICCFRTLQFKSSLNATDYIDVKWRTVDSKEIFIYLLHHRNKYVRKDILLDQFWPNTDDKCGSSQLYTAIYNIRRVLKNEGISIVIDSLNNSYRLRLNGVLIDVEKWEEQIERLPHISKSTYPIYRKLIDDYKGAYFGEDHFEWAEAEQQRVRMIWLDLINQTADYLIDIGDYSEATILYLQAQKLDPLAEDSYFMLMQLYNEIGDRFLVDLQYSNLKAMLDEEYGIEPNERVQNWYRNWMDKNFIVSYNF